MRAAPRRHLVIPDTQIRPGVPTDHIEWIAQYAVEMKPDVIVMLGDWWDFPSLNSHEKPGSIPLEGLRYKDDLEAGNEAYRRLDKPISDEGARLHRNKDKSWRPRKVRLVGNHEVRADRVASENPKLFGTLSSDDCKSPPDWEVHQFLTRVWIDGVCYSHYFQNTHSARPIGGEVSNRLNRIGCSFAHGHEQGLRHGSKDLACGKRLHGIVAGSCYLHVEDYRGAQGQDHWRGIVILNEVEDGSFSFMDVTLKFLCRKYEGISLREYMVRKYPYQDWAHLA